MIKSVYIENFRVFQSFGFDLNRDLNIVVGNNEAGKSTILEAIALALTKRIGGKLIENEISPYLFNKTTAEAYLNDLKAGKKPALPKILIELYLEDSAEVAPLRGSNNSQKADCPGIKLEIVFDEDYKEEYADLCKYAAEQKVVPAEYYKANWFSFANNGITARSLPATVFHIDATTIRLQSGTDYYIQNIISEGLTPKERAALSVAYRKLKEQFSGEASIKGINAGLTKGAITEKALTIGVDISKKANWENNLLPHLDELPFQLAGKGEQTALKIMLALNRKAKDANIILIEEPENHLSFSSMAKLISKIAGLCGGKQIIIATHSAYVLNKLGIDKVLLLHDSKAASLRGLPADTYDYFKKLSGYDTLRLILADKAILVEGPSDELIVQRAYLDVHNKMPIEDGIDVINVRGLSFERFLQIAAMLKKPVVVVTDNDGNYKRRIVEKYEPYSKLAHIKICADSDDFANTLEPQILKCNDWAVLNKLFGAGCADQASLLEYMLANKTEWALKIFDALTPIKMPNYIYDAVK